MPSENDCNRREMLKRMSMAAPLVLGAGVGRMGEKGSVKNRHGERMVERYPEFKDARSKKVMFVAHCILNQNARINKCGYTPGRRSRK